MANNDALRATVLNYSGMLFNKGNTRTPLSSIIGSRQSITNHCEFTTGQEYDTDIELAQPAITEAGSLTAPDVESVTRGQATNVTQIFHETIGVSYAKESDMGTLAGLNVANQTANPMNEMDFQAGAAMQRIANKIEYTLINGQYHKSTGKDDANKTRGLVEACTSNIVNMGGKPVSLWDIAEGVKNIHEANAPKTNLTFWVDPITMFQINADAAQNGLTVVEAARDVNGIKLSKVTTPIGDVYLKLGEYLPAGTALLLNIDVIKPVHQPTPGKGNFFREELAKVGAGTREQIFGQLGLDHGPEWYHAKFTNIATTFEKPKYSKSVYIAGGSLSSD